MSSEERIKYTKGYFEVFMETIRNIVDDPRDVKEIERLISNELEIYIEKYSKR